MQRYKHSRHKKLLLLILPVLALLLASGAYATINLSSQKPAQHTALKPGINIASGEKGLVGWWKLNGNTKDSTPYSNNGQIQGTVTPTPDRKGTANGAMAFSNQNYIRLPQQSLPTNAITVSLWAEQSALTNYYNLSVNNWPQEGGWDLWTDAAGTAHFGVYHAGAQHQATCAAGTFTTNTWHHLVGTYDGTTAKMYLDDHLCGSVAVTTTLTNSTFWSIADGTHPGLSTYAISDVRIYNRALSASDITNLYNSYNSQVNLYSPPGSSGNVNLTAGLIGYWPFNGTAKDATPFQNNGTVSGATLTSGHTGTANSAYSFNGMSNYISFPAKYNTAAGSVNMWFKTAVTQPDSPYYTFSNPGSANNSVIYLNPTSTDPTIFRGRLGDGTAIGSATVTLGVWHMATLTWQGTTGAFYMDGQNDTTDASFNGLSTIFPTTTIGCLNAFPQQCFAGAVDDIRIYNRPLTAAEIAALYNLSD